VNRCPQCRSIRVIVVVSPDPHMVCASCGAAWTRDLEGAISIRPPLEDTAEKPKSGVSDSGPIPWASA
jgi:hypothetical protein